MIYICTARSKTTYGKLIRWLTDSEYNHTFIAYECELFGGWEAVEVDAKGVNKIPLNKVLKGYTEVIAYRSIHTDLSIGLKKNKNAIGKKYDWLGIFGFAKEIIISKLFGKKTKNYWQSKNRLFCSEYVSKVLEDSEAYGFEKVDNALMNPEDILKILQGNPKYYEKVDLPNKK